MFPTHVSASAACVVANAATANKPHRIRPIIEERTQNGKGKIRILNLREAVGHNGTMRLLVLGGTAFVGRHLAQQALDRGWQVTLFHRGRTNPNLFPAATHLQGDRSTGDLEALRGGEWDACIDTSAYVPRAVRQAAAALQGRVGYMVFVSSISVYADSSKSHLDEHSELATTPDPTTEVVDGETYGPLKVLCEQEAMRAWPECMIIRPGLIVGPCDRTDRFTYWPVRMSLGGDVMVPAALDQPSQMIDVRDLASWTLGLVENRTGGVFNATGPTTPTTLGSILDACNLAAGTDANLVPIPPDVLVAEGVKPWSNLPLWLPEDALGMATVDISKAIEAGLRCRPILETAQDTLAWWHSEAPRDLLAGVSREIEEAILARHRTE